MTFEGYAISGRLREADGADGNGDGNSGGIGGGMKIVAMPRTLHRRSRPSGRSAGGGGRRFLSGPARGNRPDARRVVRRAGAKTPRAWPAAMVPHAGWIYSGRLAAAVLRRVKIPRQVIIFARGIGRRRGVGRGAVPALADSRRRGGRPTWNWPGDWPRRSRGLRARRPAASSRNMPSRCSCRCWPGWRRRCAWWASPSAAATLPSLHGLAEQLGRRAGRPARAAAVADLQRHEPFRRRGRNPATGPPGPGRHGKPRSGPALRDGRGASDQHVRRAAGGDRDGDLAAARPAAAAAKRSATRPAPSGAATPAAWWATPGCCWDEPSLLRFRGRMRQIDAGGGGALDKGTPEILIPVVGRLPLGPNKRALEQIRRQQPLIDQSRGPGDETFLFGRGRTQHGLELGNFVGIEDRVAFLRGIRGGQRGRDPTIVNTDNTTKKTKDFRSILRHSHRFRVFSFSIRRTRASCQCYPPPNHAATCSQNSARTQGQWSPRSSAGSEGFTASQFLRFSHFSETLGTDRLRPCPLFFPG